MTLPSSETALRRRRKGQSLDAVEQDPFGPPDTNWSKLLYMIDNEVHHRAQGFVYLRALGIEPPAFYER